MAQTISLVLNTLAGVLKGQLKRRAFAWLQILPQMCFAEICLKFARDKGKFPFSGIPSSLLRVRGSIEPQSDLAQSRRVAGKSREYQQKHIADTNCFQLAAERWYRANSPVSNSSPPLNRSTEETFKQGQLRPKVKYLQFMFSNGQLCSWSCGHHSMKARKWPWDFE